jgi:WD40 repeat protein
MKLVIAAAAFGLLTLLGSCVVLTIIFTRKGGGLGGFGGSYAVVDELPDPPPQAEPPMPPDSPAPPRKERAGWSAKADPPAQPVDYANAVGAPSPEQNYLLAALDGPYAVGVQMNYNPAQRIKRVKTNDPANPFKEVRLGDAPIPVIDIRTGKEVGTFPAASKLQSDSRLSSDGQYALTREFEGKAQDREVLLVWKRGAEKPVMKWEPRAPMPWVDFIGPDRIALWQTGREPRFIVLDVTKSGPVVDVRLSEVEVPPQAEPTENSHPYYRREQASGAASPGGKYVAVVGPDVVLVVDTANGKVVGQMRYVDKEWRRKRYDVPPPTRKDFRALDFDETGTELRAVYQYREKLNQPGAQLQIRILSLADGREKHVGTIKGDDVRVSRVVSGPEPGTLVVGAVVIDLASGKIITKLPFEPIRWAGPDRVLAHVALQSAINKANIEKSVDYLVYSGVFVAAFNREEYAKQVAVVAGERAKAPATRPAAMVGDRSKVAAIVAKHPEWSVKPSPAPAVPDGITLPTWPDLIAGQAAASLPDPRTWNRYDLKSKKPVAETVRLWPENIAGLEGRGTLLNAISSDGKRLARVDSSDLHRLDVWDETGKRLIGLRPYSDQTIDWLAFSANGILITVSDDAITGWDVGSGKAIYEIDGAYRYLRMAPGGTWFVGANPGRVLEFFDAATGKPLGRLPTFDQNVNYTISPDSKYLMRATGNGFEIWDLETGHYAPGAQMPAGPVFPGATFVGTRKLITFVQANGPGGQSRYLLYDLDARTHTFAFEPLKGVEFRQDALGRGWMTRPGNDGWTPAKLPEVENAGLDVVFGPGATVRVEVSAGDHAMSQKMARQAAEGLQRGGLKIGKGGWALKADHTVGHTTSRFKTFADKEITVATVTINWRLLDPSGNEVWKNTSTDTFDPSRSKYVKVGSRRSMVGPGGGGSMEFEMDFQGKNPETAQVEELLEGMVAYGSGGGVPRLVRTSAGVVKLPLEAKFELAKP